MPKKTHAKTTKAGTAKAKTSKTASGSGSSAKKASSVKKEPIKAGKAKTAAPARKKTVVPKKKQKLGERESRMLEIKSQLARQKEALLSEAESALNELPGQTIFPDLGDQATAETDRNFMLRLRGREQRLLKKIDEAIDRIESGVFGICEDCGQEIDIKRLMARPVTTMCISCKTLQEEEERLREP